VVGVARGHAAQLQTQKILQFAGNLLKFVEPKAANPAYVLLATRFKQTPYGEHALNRHWFSKERPNPPADIIAK
jgi:hypothetical protein